MRQKIGKECKWRSRLCRVFSCLLLYSCKALSHSSQMEAAVSSSPLEKKKFIVHFYPLVPSQLSSLQHFTKSQLSATAETVRMGTLSSFATLPFTYLIWQPLKQQAVPLLVICLSLTVMSAKVSKSNIHAQTDLLVLFVYKKGLYITPAAASSSPSFVFVRYSSDRPWELYKACAHLT